VIPKVDGEFDYRFWGETSLLRELALAPVSDIPPQFRLIGQVNFQVRAGAPEVIPYARLYKVEASSRGVGK
jgi:hypothetical protein